MAASLNPNAPIYIPSFSAFPPLELYSTPPPPLAPILHPQPSFHPFYIEFHETPAHTSLIYLSPPPPPPPPTTTYEESNYYLSHQTLYTCCYAKELSQSSPLGPLPPPLSWCSPKEAKEMGRVEEVLEKRGNRVITGSFGRTRVFAPKLRSRRRVLPLQLLVNKKKEGLDFEFKDDDDDSGGKTTVMIKNLPNKFTKEKLLGILDLHCCEENKKILGTGEESTTSSEFDFFYLPMDFRSGSNLGYAFVNFTNAAAAWRLYRYLHKFEWKFHGSRKVCEVTYARIQGLQSLLKHFKSSVFACNSDDFLPVAFVPARDGINKNEQHFVGKRSPVCESVVDN